jgi:hypothetical protein
MTYVKPWPTWGVLAAYVLGGMAVGLALPPLKVWAGAALGRSGLAVAFVVNIAMPLVVVALAAAYPKLGVALLGTFLATVAFLLFGGQEFPRLGGEWLVATMRQTHPILVVACVAYHVLAAVTVLFVRPWRRVRNAMQRGLDGAGE